MSIDVAEWIDAEVERSVRADRVREQRRAARRSVTTWTSRVGTSLSSALPTPPARPTSGTRTKSAG